MAEPISVSLYKVKRTSTTTAGKTTDDEFVAGPFPARVGWTKPESGQRENSTGGLETRRRRLLFIDSLSAPVVDGLVVKNAAGTFRGKIDFCSRRSDHWQTYLDMDVDRI